MVFLADLMELLFGESDLILEMEWLVKHRVVVIGERRDYLTNVISVLVAEKLVRKGCEAFLAYISVSDFRDSSVKSLGTVRDFLDVVLEELPGLPPSQEVEFRIELISGTAPVSIAPYRVAPKELTKLKAQIQELLDRGFIVPICLIGEHRCCL
ncbi:hypothetical protein EPI10_001916 [Gossypium australe]|uniref:DNA/RNA polymerases superfamily protein n=1 Tax=Gossypium australe TaxID=47621 RepID=A0A5B6VCM8_9ROSI|nr:hypothetical protein EPI10_001916 [Gossypium australe]